MTSVLRQDGVNLDSRTLDNFSGNWNWKTGNKGVIGRQCKKIKRDEGIQRVNSSFDLPATII